MLGNKKTFISDKIFYKEYTKKEFYFLKMLHGADNLHLDTITKDNIQYIEMPAGNIISIDTITKKQRNNKSIKNIIIKNIPFILDQIILLNNLNIYYSDCLQFLYHNNKLYLIDFDVAYITKIDYNHNNYDHLFNFLLAFDINYDYIKESLNMLDLFKTGCSFFEEELELYNKINNPNMQKKYVYYCKNNRHIQINIDNIHIYGKTGNIIITENILNPEVAKEWELLRIV